MDRSEWHMPAHLVNAYYDPQQNPDCFPAAILQAPFMIALAPSANYGGIGAAMRMKSPMLSLTQTVLPLTSMVALKLVEARRLRSFHSSDSEGD